MLVEVREETPKDIAAIREVNLRAFGQPQEANIVDALRSNRGSLLSLVGTAQGRVLGHILYSPVTVGETSGAALGPMAVLPEFQRHGIGSKLVVEGNQKLRDSGIPFVVVLGHAPYYPRFGFKPAGTFGLKCEWEVPAEVFMLLILDRTKMMGVSGLVRYRQEFSTVL